MANEPLELPEAFALAAAAWRRGLVSSGAIRDAKGRRRLLDQFIDPGAETERAHFESYYGELRAFWRIAADEARRRPAPQHRPLEHPSVRKLRMDLGQARRAVTMLRDELARLKHSPARVAEHAERAQMLDAIRVELEALELRRAQESGPALERLKGAILALRWLLDRQLLPRPSRHQETTP